MIPFGFQQLQRQIPILQVADDLGLVLNRHNRCECPADHRGRSRNPFHISTKYNRAKCWHTPCEANKPLDPLGLWQFVTGESVLEATRSMAERYMKGKYTPNTKTQERKITQLLSDYAHTIWIMKNELLIYRFEHGKILRSDRFKDAAYGEIDREYTERIAAIWRRLN